MADGALPPVGSGRQLIATRRPDREDERYLSVVQHLASVLAAAGWGEDVLLALGELLEMAGVRQTSDEARANEDIAMSGKEQAR